MSGKYAQRAFEAEATLREVQSLMARWYEHLDRSQCPSCLTNSYCDHGEGYHHAYSDLEAIFGPVAA